MPQDCAFVVTNLTTFASAAANVLNGSQTSSRGTFFSIAALIALARFSASARSGANSLKQGGSCWLLRRRRRAGKAHARAPCRALRRETPCRGRTSERLALEACQAAGTVAMMAAIGTARIEIIPAPGGTLALSVPGCSEVKHFIAAKSGNNTATCRNLTEFGLNAARPRTGSAVPVPDKPHVMPRYDFRTPRLFVDAALAGARRSPLARSRRTISSTCCGSSRRAGSGVQRARRRMARALGAAGKKSRPAATSTAAHARADRARRPALSVRAAQARAARLHGAESGRDGRLAASAGADAPYPGRAGQSRRACARMRSRPPSSAASSTLPEIAEPVKLDAMRFAAGCPTGCWCSATRMPR